MLLMEAETCEILTSGNPQQPLALYGREILIRNCNNHGTDHESETN